MKKLLLCFFFFTLVTIPFILHAQVAPSIEWQKCLGGSGYESANSIRQTLDGGFIIAGYSDSNDGDVTGNHGLKDYWIVKLDTAGNLEWQKSLGGSLADYASSVQQTSDSGFIVSGNSYSNDGDVTGNHRGLDYWILKLDVTGNLLWQKSLGGTDEDDATSILQTFDGGYIAAGGSKSNDGDVSINHGDFDYWIVKLDAQGNLVRQKSFGGSKEDFLGGIQQNSTGGFIVAGYAFSNNGNVSGNHGANDYWILKLDTASHVVWQKCFGGSSDDWANYIAQTSDNGFIVAGSSNSNDGDVSENHGQEDYWIIKLDTSGNLEWHQSLGGTLEDNPYSIQQTNDGGFIIGGWTASMNDDILGNHGDWDYWIVKLNLNGNLQWQKCLGGNATDIGFSIQQTSDNGFIVAGKSSSDNGDVSGDHGSYDFWIVKLSPEIPTTISSPSTNSIFISPNPAHDQFQISFSDLPIENSQLRISNLFGEKVFTQKITGTNQMQIDISNLAAGVYVVEIISAEWRSVAKLVKE